MSAPTSPVVILERVGHRFGPQVALESVSTCIRPGEFVAIIGRSGAGKTTLLRCLSRAIVAHRRSASGSAGSTSGRPDGRRAARATAPAWA